MRNTLQLRKSRTWIALGVIVMLPAFGTRHAQADTYDLEGLLKLTAQHNPGVMASAKGTRQVEAQLSEAKRSWLPTGEFRSILAPSPSIQCSNPLPKPDDWNKSDSEWQQLCLTTGNPEVNIGFSGIFTRNEITLTQPVYTFGKIESGISAARAGIEASRSGEAAVKETLALNVKRAYYGFKLMREILATLEEANGYVDEAETLVQQDLDEGNGNMSITDKLRLQTVRAELETKMLEAKKGQSIALSGLRALIGVSGPHDIQIDKEPLALDDVKEQGLRFFSDQAQMARPELRALNFLVKARDHLAQFEWNRMMPDLVLIGTARYAYASSVDNPRSAFSNDPFNNRALGLAAALRVPLDFGVASARADRMRASAEQAEFQRQDAQAGVNFEVEKAHTELNEARERVVVVGKGEKLAKRWISSIMQKMQLGLGDIKEVSDALTRYFSMRVLYLQAIHDFNMAAAQLERATGTDVNG
jgi:outer membrane protein